MRAAAALGAMTPLAAHAGAWPTPKGETQVILKFETMRAEEGFDLTGARAPLPAEQVDQVLGLFVEYGLTDRVTLQAKGDWQDGEDAFADYQGRGPVELGVRVNVWRDDWTVLSLYAGYAWGGDARNAVYAPPGAGESDWDLRVLAGRSFAWRGAFVEVQAARRLRDGLPDETRLDLSAGAELAPGWSVLNQVFAGRSEEGGEWANLETSVVRTSGAWSLQAGWRQTVAGRNVPDSRGPMLAVWRRF
jgi:protein XagA